VQTEATSNAGTRRIPDAEVDLLLAAQLGVAWSGESAEDPRLGWWKTNLMSEFGGEDLFQRLLPQTWDWAVVQALREAARRHDAQMRAKAHDPDTVVSLYRLGFTIDERADERLLELKRGGLAPGVVFPSFGDLVGEGWRRETFEHWVRSHGDAAFQTAPAGRQLRGPPPSSLEQTVNQLVAALLPLAERYPLPHFRKGR
jgi:hypothetical protein